jgi:hypothetical protein
MATTHRTRIKQLERADAELAALRDQRARIDARIASLESTRKKDLVAFAADILNGMDLARVSASTICARLTSLHDAVVRNDEGHIATVDANAAYDKVEAFVKISRNASEDKRKLLENAGLHWHGRDGGWTGAVGSASLAQLRDVFGDKVEKPPSPPVGESPLPAQESAVVPAHIDEEPVTVQSQAEVIVAESPCREVATSTPVHRNPLFRSFPPRRPAQQQAEEPS